METIPKDTTVYLNDDFNAAMEFLDNNNWFST